MRHKKIGIKMAPKKPTIWILFEGKTGVIIGVNKFLKRVLY